MKEMHPGYSRLHARAREERHTSDQCGKVCFFSLVSLRRGGGSDSRAAALYGSCSCLIWFLRRGGGSDSRGYSWSFPSDACHRFVGATRDMQAPTAVHIRKHAICKTQRLASHHACHSSFVPKHTDLLAISIAISLAISLRSPSRSPWKSPCDLPGNLLAIPLRSPSPSPLRRWACFFACAEERRLQNEHRFNGLCFEGMEGYLGLWPGDWCRSQGRRHWGGG